MKKILFLFLIVSAQLLFAQDAERIRVACVGNSITYGAGIQHRFQNCYPMYLQQYMGTEYDVRNFGISARTMLSKGDHPYIQTSEYRQMLEFNPQIVIVKLGTNDSKPHNWEHKSDFIPDMMALVDTIKALPSHPQIYLCLPVPAKTDPYTITDSVIRKGVIPAIRKVAKRQKLPVIDLYTAMTPYFPDLFPDHCHPNAQGAATMAGVIYKQLTGNEAPQAHDPQQPFPGRKSEWEGHERYDFVLYGRAVTVVTPSEAAPGKPWIWRPAFFGAFPSVDKALVERGYHIAYYDLTHLYGSPRSVELGNRFYSAMHNEFGLNEKVVVEGLSRGGYFAFNWGAKNPDKVACLYVDAPVCDVTSWPGRERTDLWEGFLHEWGIQDAGSGAAFSGNALALVDPLLAGNVPIIAVCGDADKTVPYTDNFQPFLQEYQSRGGIVMTILKPGCDHHPHSLDDPSPVVRFIESYCR